MTPSKHPLWPAFVLFAGKYGIPLEYKDDWEAWWECFTHGAEAQAAIMIQTGPDVLGKDEED